MKDYSNIEQQLSAAKADLNAEKLRHLCTRGLLQAEKDDNARCDAIACGWNKPFDFNKELARPALFSVSRMAQERDSLKAKLAAHQKLAEWCIQNRAAIRYRIAEEAETFGDILAKIKEGEK